MSDLEPEQVKALTDLMTLLQQGAEARTGQAASAAAGPGALQQIRTVVENFGARVADQFRNLPELFFRPFFSSLGALVSGSVAGPFHILIGAIALILAVGLAAEFLVNRLVHARRDAIRTRTPATLLETVKLVTSRAALDLSGLVVFAIVALVVGRIAIQDPVTRSFALQAVFWIVFLPRLAAALMRFALAPHRRELRLVTADDATAKSLYRSFTSLFAFVGVVFFSSEVLLAAGADHVTETFRFFIGLAVNAWIIAVIWNARHGLTSILMGDEEEPTVGLQRMARFWPYFFPWLSLRSTGCLCRSPPAWALTR
ncbi:hypothetical protein QW131_28195 [Roseibium salinum]|nr:hypothetical protein [Roseibium salinum]